MKNNLNKCPEYMKDTSHNQCKVYVQRNAWTIGIDKHTLYWFGNIASTFPISPTIFQQVNVGKPKQIWTELATKQLLNVNL